MHISDVLPILFEGNERDEIRYHKDVGIPGDLTYPTGFTKNSTIDLEYRNGHGEREALKDKYGIMHLPHRIDLRKGDIFEVATAPGSKVINKVCVRMSYDAEKDIIFVVEVPSGRVRTVWANLKTDKHHTLNRSNYANPYTNNSMADKLANALRSGVK